MIAARPHQALWKQLLAAPAPVTTGELSAAIGASFQTADFRLGQWVRAGLVERHGRRPHRYRLAPTTERTALPPAVTSGGRAKPRVPAAYQRLWAAIRVLKRFDLPILAMTSGASARATRAYVGLLQRTGYVRLEKLGNPHTGVVSRYVLIRNGGRLAPRETIVRAGDGRRRELVDPNTGERQDVSRGTPSRRRAYRKPGTQDGGVG